MAIFEVLPLSAFRINIDSLVSQVLALEARPLSKLQVDQNALTLKSATLSDLKSSLSVVRSKVHLLVQSGTLSPFQAKRAISSNTAVFTATTSPSASPGVHTLSVSQLAKLSTVVSKQLSTTGTEVASAEGSGTKSIRVTYDGSDPATSATAVTVNVTVSDGETNATILTKLASAIRNDATLGGKISASVVTDTSNTARLVLTSRQTGLANKLRVGDATGGGTLIDTIQLDSENASAGAAGGFLYADAALDAKFKLNGLAIERSSNSVNDVLSGVTINLLGVSASDVTLTVNADIESIKASVQSFLDAYNGAVTFLRARTGVKVSTTVSSTSLTQVNSVIRGSLSAESVYLTLLSSLRADVIQPSGTVQAGNPAALGDIGITPASDGTLSISNAAKFEAAVNTNLTGLMDLFASSDGFGSRLISRLDGFVNTGGVIDGSASTVAAKAQDINRQISTVQDRLKNREAALRRQLSSLQETLNALSAQRFFFQ